MACERSPGFQGLAVLVTMLACVMLAGATDSFAQTEEADAPPARADTDPADHPIPTTAAKPATGFWEEADRRLLSSTAGTVALAHVGTARRIVLSPPVFDRSLVGARIEARRISTGAYYNGVVLEVLSDRLQLDVGSTVSEEILPFTDIDHVITLGLAAPPLRPGDLVTLVSRRGERVSGAVLRLHEEAVVLELAPTIEGTVKWSQVREILVRREATREGPIDLCTIGVQPVPVYQPQPPYPGVMRLSNTMGRVIVEIVVDPEGRVVEAKPLRGNPHFAEAALAAVTRWRYQPVLVAGQPIAWKDRVCFRFVLR